MVNRVAMAFLLTTFLSCLLMPGSLELHRSLGVSPNTIPVYSWIANVPGVEPGYPDFFLLSWALLPCWLLVYGLAYASAAPATVTSISKLVMAWLIAVALLCLILFLEIDVSQGSGRAARIFAAAARIQWFGAVIFSGVFFFLFGAFAIAFVVAPIRLTRGFN